MSAPVIIPLGASTLIRKWIFEVNSGTIVSPTWLPINGITNSQFNADAENLQDDSDMNSGGAGSQTKTAGMASAQLTVARKVQPGSPTLYDAGQEFLRGKGINKYGPDNSVQLRVSEYTPSGGPRVEAYVGFFAVGWSNQGGGNVALDTVQITLSGQGACVPIAHPYPPVTPIPTITSVTPSALQVAGGKIVRIVGTGFMSTVPTTGLTIGGTASPSWDVESDTLIVAVYPAHVAGTALAVVITNSAGASTGGPTVTYV